MMLKRLSLVLAPSLVLAAFACGEDAVDGTPVDDVDASTKEDSGKPLADSGTPSDAGADARDATAPNPCATNNGGCGPNAVCTAPSGTALCTCKPGFGSDAGDAGTCEDIDECATNNGGCGANAACANTVGGRTCTCDPGYVADGGVCGDIDECAVANGGCGLDATCANTPGGRTCTCKTGYEGDGGVCDDIDECAVNNGGCSANATCANTIGGRTCTCKSGYEGSGETCTDIDECAVNNGGCSANATCANTTGSRTCTCKPVYSGDGETCTIVTTTFATDTDLGVTNTGTRSCADGGDMVSYSVTALSATEAQVGAPVSAGCLAPGDEVLLVNVQGTAASAVNTGNYERLVVSAVHGSTITFGAAKTKLYGAGANDDANIGITAGHQRVVLQRIPAYGNVVVDSGVSVTAPIWNGTKGGIFALRAAGTVTVAGKIHMDAKGYRGGASPLGDAEKGQQGESIRGLGALASELAWDGGGGGGFGDFSCRAFGTGGSGGSYGSVGTKGSNTCGGGSAGGVYGDANLTKLHLGSGGGSGGNDNTILDNPRGGFGGRGGGLVYILAAGAVSGTGTISAVGAAGQGDAIGIECSSASTTECWDFSGPGGGGSGGSVVVSASAFSATASVIGGVGGNGLNTDAGNGGNGGSGRSKTN